MNDWISVNDRMPEKSIDVLCFSNGRIFHCFWDDASSFCDWYDIQNNWIIGGVTHWMELPSPPLTENKEKFDK